MVQGSAGSRNKSILFALAHALGTSQILGWCGWILLVRAGQASLGLRLIQEHSALRWLSELGARGQNFVPACLAVSGTLAGIVAMFLPRQRAILRLCGLLVAMTALVGFWAQRNPRLDTPSVAWLAAGGLALAGLSLRIPLRHRALLLVSALALGWQGTAKGTPLPSWVTSSDPLIEALVLLSAGVFVLPWSRGRWIALVPAVFALAACLGYAAASRHVLVHLTGLGQAGLPWWLTSGLLALAVAGVVALWQNYGWRAALPLAIVLTVVRNPDYPSHSLVLWAATLLPIPEGKPGRSRLRRGA